jgi:hypothetical protein
MPTRAHPPSVYPMAISNLQYCAGELAFGETRAGIDSWSRVTVICYELSNLAVRCWNCRLPLRLIQLIPSPKSHGDVAHDFASRASWLS